MNKETILQSNLLNIIFDNRNKDYGAYTLRKNYNKRIEIALFLMILSCIAFCLLFLLKDNSSALKNSVPIFVPDKTISKYKLESYENKSVAKISHHKKEAPPKIVAATNINKLSATQPEILSSPSGELSAKIDFPSVAGNENTAAKGINPEAVVMPVISKAGPVETAEVMPTYPGGIKALLAFLRKNLRAPEEIADGNEISVKIKFIVNYNGRLEGFDVIKSGGTVFDEEVLRVLRKCHCGFPEKVMEKTYQYIM